MLKLRFVCVALIALLTSQAAKADVYSQIPGTFAPTLLSGAPGNLSQFDLGATAPNLQNFATAYDDFSFSFAGSRAVTNISWIGTYESRTTTPLAPNFIVSLYADDTSGTGGFASQPGAPIQTFNVGTANETAIASHPDFFNYTTTLAPFSITGGTKYWMSVVAELDYTFDGWGMAFSGMGNGDSFQDFGDLALTRFPDPVDYAFSVTVVPEPGAFGLGLVLAGCAAFRRRRAA